MFGTIYILSSLVKGKVNDHKLRPCLF